MIRPAAALLLTASSLVACADGSAIPSMPQAADPSTPAPPVPVDGSASNRALFAGQVDRARRRPPPSAAATATPPAPSIAGEGGTTVRVGTVLTCIRDHESGGDYTIVNASGYAGAYQLSPAYSPTWARRYGYPRWAPLPANLWPRNVQDAVARALFNDWPQAWSTYWECA